MFFDLFIREIRHAKPQEFSNDVGWIVDASGNTSHLSDDNIVRLGRAIDDVNAELERLRNPATGGRYPQLLVGELAPEKHYQGAFFFLGDRQIEQGHKEIAVSEADSTGSSVLNRPDIKVFRAPDSYQIQGINLSEYDGNVDLTKVRAAGIQYVYLRSTDATLNVDNKFLKNWNNAHLAGLAVGVYHVLNYCMSPEKQVAALRETVPADERLLPIAIDTEMFQMTSNQTRCSSNGQGKQQILAFAKLVEKAFGKVPIIFVPSSLAGQILDSDFDKYSIWLGSYRETATPSLPGKNPWTIWEFTDKAQLPDIDQRLQKTVFFGTSAQFEQFAAGRGNIALAAAVSPSAKQPISK